jgi:hypothetical protein
MNVTPAHDGGLTGSPTPTSDLERTRVLEKLALIRKWLNVKYLFKKLIRVLRNLDASNLFPSSL